MSSLYFDRSDPNIGKRLQALNPLPGYCVFIDVVDSTALKDQPMLKWAAALANVFENAAAFLATSPVLKYIGDELMYYVPDGAIRALANPAPGSLAVTFLGDEAHTLLTSLVPIAREPDPLFERVKIAVAHCTDAYPLTFVKGRDDIYGKDIDLTARLKSRANPRDIVMNEPFYRLLEQARATMGADQCPEVGQIVGPWPESFKGFKQPVPIYKLPAP